MAIRFVDSSFHKSPFVRSLKGSLKSLYGFIICDCNGAGIWSPDFQIASLFIGFEVTKKEFEDAFVSTGKAILLPNGKYFFPDFIQHQYPKGLSHHNPSQKNFIKELLQFGLISEDLKVIERPFKDSTEGLHRPISIGIGNSNGNSKGKGKPIEKSEHDKEIDLIIEFLNLKASSTFRKDTKSTRALIIARLKEGFSPEDFASVINHKVDVWGQDLKMKEYLRPETLFGPKFEGYLQSSKVIVMPGTSKIEKAVNDRNEAHDYFNQKYS